MNLFAVAALSCAISCALLALLAFLFGKSRLHRLLLSFNVVVAVWGLGLYLVGIATTESEAFAGWKLAHVGGFFVGPTFYHMVSTFCNRVRKRLLYLGYGQAIAFAVTGLATDVVFQDLRYVYGLHYHQANLLYTVAALSYHFYVFLGYYILFRYLSASEGHKHRQAQYMAFGFSFGFIGATLAFLPMFGIDIIYPFGNLGITVYCFIATYAILRHRLMEIQVVLKKSLIYSLAASLITGLFVVLVVTITKYFSDAAGITSFAITAIAALTIALIFAPLKNGIQVLVDRVFYKTSYNHFSIVQKLSKDLAHTVELKKICPLIVDTLYETLKLQSLHLVAVSEEGNEILYSRPARKSYTDEGSEPDDTSDVERRIQESETKSLAALRQIDSVVVRLLKEEKHLLKENIEIITDRESALIIQELFVRHESELVIPLFVNGEPAFLMFLGKKLSGDIFSSEDIDMLETVANQASVTLKNAMLYDELEDRVERRTRELSVVNMQLHTEIIERERTQDELQEIHRELELRIEERTADLKQANEKLKQEIAERKQTEDRLIQSKTELNEQIEDLEKFYDMAVSRELKMKELKEEIRLLEKKISNYEMSGVTS